MGNLAFERELQDSAYKNSKVFVWENQNKSSEPEFLGMLFECIGQKWRCRQDATKAFSM
jgi:hypothetical protein